MSHPCEFHPTLSVEACGRPANKKVRLTTKDPEDESWLWVCDDCMGEAVAWWGGKGGWHYEF